MDNKPYENPSEKPDMEQADFSRPDFQFVPEETHTWRQQGPYVVCRTCGLEHAIFIGMEKRMIGIHENGLPILVEKV